MNFVSIVSIVSIVNIFRVVSVVNIASIANQIVIIVSSVYLIITGKYFLYTNAINKKMFQFADYINLVCDKIEIEKYISVVTNTPTIFVKKWCRFIH